MILHGRDDSSRSVPPVAVASVWRPAFERVNRTAAGESAAGPAGRVPAAQLMDLFFPADTRCVQSIHLNRNALSRMISVSLR